MARNVTLLTLRTQARELADMEVTGATAFVDDTELNGIINTSAARWYGRIIQAVPERFETVQTLTASGAVSYDVPDDYMYTLAVEYESTQDRYIDLRRVMFAERNRFNTRGTSSMAIGYRVGGPCADVPQLYLYPPPSTGTYRHIYVPVWEDLSVDTQTVDGYNGWEQWIVYDAAIRMLMKEEADVSTLISERNALGAEMDAAAADREMSAPQRIADVRSLGHGRRFLVNRFHDPDFWA